MRCYYPEIQDDFNEQLHKEPGLFNFLLSFLRLSFPLCISLLRCATFKELHTVDRGRNFRATIQQYSSRGVPREVDDTQQREEIINSLHYHIQNIGGIFTWPKDVQSCRTYTSYFLYIATWHR